MTVLVGSGLSDAADGTTNKPRPETLGDPGLDGSGCNSRQDVDLAVLYGVETRALVQAVKRNLARFPEDFMFQLTQQEFATLTSQIVISKGRGGRRSAPYAFTEQGVAMLSSVLRSKRAVLVNVEIMRTFVRLRKLLASHADLARKMTMLEQKYDAKFKIVFDAIRQLMTPSDRKKRPIGFISQSEKRTPEQT